MRIRLLFLLTMGLLLGTLQSRADAPDYSQDPTYNTLRDSMHRAFNTGDSARFFVSVKNLEDYLLAKDDLHAYYTQRCNEIVFLMNRNQVFEAYKLARRLSHELRERKLDKEMYMAVNMMGHIYRYCGKKDAARKCFEEVIERMEQAGYRESMPPIYMNIVNVEMEENPEEALRLLDKAVAIAAETSPARVFDIETRRTLAAYNMGDREKFLEGYKAYKEGEAQGLTSVHGRTMEIYYQAALGNIDQAVKMARDNMGDDSYGTIARLYRDAGRWKEAYEALQEETKANDSINSEILSNNMDGIQDELRVYEAERTVARNRIVTLLVVLGLLLALVLLMAYIIFSRRRHIRQLKRAYDHALESDRMKTAFIQNVSHEVRTPLNIIGGYAQVLADPELETGPEERKEIAKTVMDSTSQITALIDEMLMLSLNESDSEVPRDDRVEPLLLVQDVLREVQPKFADGVKTGIDSSLPEGFSVQTNETMLRCIVAALTDNAAKYTESGAVTIRLATTTAGQHTIDAKAGRQPASDSLLITVEDSGPGISPSDAERIFDRFVKLNDFKEGLGLGLPLCRRLSERLGGSVALDPAYTSGARFIVSLPL